MLEQEFQISKLILAEISQSSDESEQLRLKEWIESSKANADFYHQFVNQVDLKRKYDVFCGMETERIRDKVQAELLNAEHKLTLSRPEKVFRSKLAIAAMIAASLVAAAVWFLPVQNKDTKGLKSFNDIAPGKQGATLTLSNGQKIRLSDALVGTLAEYPDVKISKSADGQLSYNVKDSGGVLDNMNTLTTDDGEIYQVVLPDGSRVWLNASSSLVFPLSFRKAAKRELKLTGEAYFEVAKDKTRPFIVETNRQKLEVLGTHFNLNAYDDDASVKTTLMEGRVVIHSQFKDKLLQPGEQSVVSSDHISVSQANMEEAVDWKNGKIIFNDMPLEQIMKKISRWYDLEVTFLDGTEKILFQGSISRNKQLSSVLNFFRDTETIDFIIQGRKITVFKKH